MKIFIGADHRGYKLKLRIIKLIEGLGHDVQDLGTHDDQKSCDYPKVGFKVASAVADHQGSRGILVCMSGIGQAIVANKVKGAYAALCHNPQAAALSRQHNNANILVLGAKFINAKDLEKIIKTWLKTEFEGGRHRRRFDQIRRVEQGKSIS